MIYKVLFDTIQYPTRIATNTAISTVADDAEMAQELVIDLLESLNAVPGNILSIQRGNEMPQSGVFPVAIA
jgi:hypothetical protein